MAVEIVVFTSITLCVCSLYLHLSLITVITVARPSLARDNGFANEIAIVLSVIDHEFLGPCTEL